MPTELIHEPAAFRAACSRARAGGARLGLVPTMGALHEGHLALVQEARRRGAQKVALTIFVNPLQFGPNEDFDRYPRTLESDLARCQEAGVELVFAPERRAMYPDDFATSVRITGITERLEGAHRPGHFDGVTTVVAKLFALTGECIAVFGRKDYQQWRVLDRLARDLDLPVEVVGMPTVREVDGLALSSRNRYLSEEQRARALSIARGLRAAHAAFAGGIRNSAALAARVRAEMEPAFDSIDYVEAADPDTLAEAPSIATDRLLLVVAARIGGTRLIDNTVLGQDAPPGVAW